MAEWQTRSTINTLGYSPVRVQVPLPAPATLEGIALLGSWLLAFSLYVLQPSSATLVKCGYILASASAFVNLGFFHSSNLIIPALGAM